MWDELLKKTKIEELYNIPWLNSGGCGFAALGIYKVLKREGFKPKIVFEGDEPHHISGEDVPGHVLVKVKDPRARKSVFIDGYGWYERLNRPYRKEMPLKTLKKLLNNRDGWNFFFDRAHVPLIAKTLGVEL